MREETPHDELVRLRSAQIKAQRDEVYGGFSQAEKADYNSTAERIGELEKGVAEEGRIGELRKRLA